MVVLQHYRVMMTIVRVWEGCGILNMRYFFCFVLILLRCQLAFQFSAIRTSLGNIELQTTNQILCYHSGRNLGDSKIIYISYTAFYYYAFQETHETQIDKHGSQINGT